MKILFILIVFGLLWVNQSISEAPNSDILKSDLIGDGLTGNYYEAYFVDTTNTITFNNLNPAFSQTDTIIDFWNGDRYYRWEPVTGWGDYYSIEWKGYIYIVESGQYGFGTISDDGSQVFIDSVLIVDNWETQWYDWEDNVSEGDTSGTTFPPLILDSGFHNISISFYEDAYYYGIELWWLKPGLGPSDIPYYGTNFHGTPPTYNPNTNWELIPKEVLFTSIDSITSTKYRESRKRFPTTFQILQNYPNPFNPTTTIEFDLPKTSEVSLKVFNILGEEVATLVSDRLSAGSYSYDWDASNLASGVYLYRMQAGDYVDTRKMVFMQ
jgi:hypothetical protein